MTKEQHEKADIIAGEAAIRLAVETYYRVTDSKLIEIHLPEITTTDELQKEYNEL